MDTINGIFFLTAALVGSTAMCGCIVCVVDYIRLFLTARGTIEQIEAREDALIGMAILAGAFAIAALTHFIGMETIHWIIRLVTGLVALAGICVGALGVLKSAFLVVTARGDVGQIAEAKTIFRRSVMGMALIAATWVILTGLRVG